ncbi:MAG: cysteine hydrolase family protein [Desulfuromonas sp.]|nr:cysteine hydrolase family protein [Desulfuromonas sp.]
MSEFPTLFQLTGSEHPVAQWQDAVLVIIDAQNEYRMGDMKLPNVESATVQIQRLLVAARQHGSPVAHIRHIGVPGYLFDPEGPRGQIFAELTPIAGEAVIDKPLPNAFAGSSLQDFIQKSGRTSLIVCGFMTHMCVSATVRAAKDLGYQSTVVADACATRSLASLEFAHLDAQALHDMELVALSDFFAYIVKDAVALGA